MQQNLTIHRVFVIFYKKNMKRWRYGTDNQRRTRVQSGIPAL